MNCDAYRILITGYIDKELSDSEMQTLKVHLTNCESCLHYLQRQETMQAALKRYSLFQEIPEVPINFASNVTEQLQGILQEEQPVSFREELTTKTRAVVMQFVDWWANSLKARPFAWTASISCFFVLFAGLLFFEVYQRSYSPSNMFHAEVSKTVPSDSPKIFPQSSRETVPQIMNAQTQEIVGKEETVALVDLDMETLIQFEEVNNGDEQPFLRVAHNETGSVEDYIYSHMIEVNQDRLVDDAVFVGYVQDVSIQ